MPRSQSSKQNRIAPIKPVQKPLIQQPLIQKPLQPQQLGSPSVSIFQSIKQGFGFGLGNSIAHSLFSPKQVTTVEPDVKASRSIGASSASSTSSASGTSATQDITGQIEYLQCMKEGGTEDSCNQYIV